jgi:apolipoprotein N-acyltransferase
MTVALLPGIVLSTEALGLRLRAAFIFLTGCFVAGLASAGWFLHFGDVEPPRGWIAVNTHFGDVSEPFRDFAAAQFIQRKAAGSSARVVIFPESVVPRWSAATEAFLRKSLDQCRRRGQILAIGAGLPSHVGGGKDESEKFKALRSFDFGSAIAALQDMNAQSQRRTDNSWSVGSQSRPRAERIENTMLIVGAESATFYQRVPVPLGMWRPFDRSSVPVRVGGPGLVKIDHQRTAVLICYEQLLTFPILASVLEHPAVIVGISNTFWIAHTTIPRYQANALRSWAKLFGLPYLSAVNS